MHLCSLWYCVLMEEQFVMNYVFLSQAKLSKYNCNDHQYFFFGGQEIILQYANMNNNDYFALLCVTDC